MSGAPLTPGAHSGSGSVGLVPASCGRRGILDEVIGKLALILPSFLVEKPDVGAPKEDADEAAEGSDVQIRVGRISRTRAFMCLGQSKTALLYSCITFLPGRE